LVIVTSYMHYSYIHNLACLAWTQSHSIVYMMYCRMW